MTTETTYTVTTAVVGNGSFGIVKKGGPNATIRVWLVKPAAGATSIQDVAAFATKAEADAYAASTA